MSKSDQNGEAKLTRKQLRELRLTGSTPVITEEEAVASAAASAVLPRAAEPAPIPPAPSEEEDVDLEHSPRTRRAARAQERVRTASVPIFAPASVGASGSSPQAATAAPAASAVSHPAEAEQAPVDEASAEEGTVEEGTVDEVAVEDVSSDDAHVEQPPVEDEQQPVVTASETIVASVPVFAAAPAPVEEPEQAEDDESERVEGSDDSDAEGNVDESSARATVNSAFGERVGETAPAASIPQLFDHLLDSDSGGSQHTAPNAMIFTPAPGGGSLSGPVASTGELLITGSYDLPEGLGSRGHAHGTTDGKDVDAVLIDGELPATSSPTPIAASSAVSTSKPAGEVIRPPAPDKGNKLMLTLAIVAGGLALALGAVLIVAFTSNLFG